MVVVAVWVCWVEQRLLDLDCLVFDDFSPPALKKRERDIYR